MKYLTLFFLILCSTPLALQAISAEDFVKEDQKAQALFAAHDKDQATSIYQRILKHPLPDWQKVIVLYNLGTILIAQEKWEEALDEFSKIPPNQISSPLLFRYLRMNEGFAYLKLSQAVSKHPTQESDLNQAIYLLDQSMANLALAAEVDCEIQKLEEGFFDCQSRQDIQELSDTATLELERLHQLQRDHLMNKGGLEAVLALLHEGNQKWINAFNTLKNVTLEDSIKKSYHDYFFYEGETLAPLWGKLRALTETENEKYLGKEGETYYKNALKAFKKGQWDSAEVSLKQLTDILNQFNLELYSSSSEGRLNLLLLHYQILFTEDPLSQLSLSTLVQEQQDLSTKFQREPLYQQANDYLHLAHTQLSLENESIAHFFFYQSFFLLQDLKTKQNSKPTTSKEILTQAIRQAAHALQLNRLASIQKPDQHLIESMQQILKKSQQQVIDWALPFIKAVIDEETIQYRQVGKEIQRSRCQKNPWKQVIPLFEEGYQAALRAQPGLDKSLPASPTTLQNQGETLSNWQKALNLLNDSKNSSDEQEQQQQQPESQQKDQDSGPNSAPKKMDEIFRLLQEMQSQDSPQPVEGVQKERHTW
jgi:outer membrane protein assembly factor BamD (BamD/ComL family)